MKDIIERHISYSSENGFDEKTLESIGFSTIKSAIVERTRTLKGKALAELIAPVPDIDTARKRLKTTISAKNLINIHGRPSIDIPDGVEEAIKQSQLQGAILRASQIFDIGHVIKVSLKIKRTLSKYQKEFKPIWEIAEGIKETDELLNHINSILDERGEVRDDATENLKKIRADIRQLRERIYTKLEGYIKSRKFSDSITEEAVVIRNERYCIPVRAEDVSRVGGIVHARSSSGHTSFLEPYTVVDDNNRLSDLRSEEEAEIRRILEHATSIIGAKADELKENIDILSVLDLSFAIGELSLALPTTEPQLERSSPLTLIRALNPQLSVMAINDGNSVEESIIPIDVFLDRDRRVVVISGPNAGGKTVSLKTVGLICAMAYSGIPITAKEGTAIPYIDNILADIGEEESVEEALSSFTSHIIRLKEILFKASENSLVLLDELGRSTAPDYGSAIGVAVAEHILKTGAYCMITTHYDGVKSMAVTNLNMVNASVEFSPEDGRPTYRLIWGSYGSSHALETAYNAGLPDDIIRRAREYLGEEKIQLESIIDRYERQLVELGRMREKLDGERLILEENKRKHSEEIEAIRAEKKAIKRERNRLIRKGLDDFRRELRELLKRAREGGEREIIKALERVSTIEKECQEEITEDGIENIPDGLEIGAWVRLKDSDIITQIINVERRSKRATINLRGKKLEVNLSELTPVESIQEDREKAEATYDIRGDLENEIMVRGMTVEEATAFIDRHLQRAFLSGLDSITIIHGLGTGRLRDGIRSFLRNHPLVSSFRAGGEREGGDGVTIVMLSDKS